MNFESKEISIPKRKHEEIEIDIDGRVFVESMKKEEEEFLQLLQEASELMKAIPSPPHTPIPSQKEEKKEVDSTSSTPDSSTAGTPEIPTDKAISIPSWKQELQKKFDSVATIEDLDHLTKEIVKKNRPRKLPKKKLVRVENFYQRHISGLEWMNNFLNRTKADAISRPYVERMLEMEKQFKTMIENDELLGPQLAKDE
jgi:hypothetical protein